MSGGRLNSLFSPLVLGGKTLKNRLVLAPMTRARADPQTNVPGPLALEYYRQRAGAGLLITEGTFVSGQAIGWYAAPGIFTEEQTNAWIPIVKAVQSRGANFYCQLWHCGRASHSSLTRGNLLPVSSSALAIRGDIHTASGKQPHEVPRPLAAEEMPQVVAEFRQAALNAKAAGFDGVELHGANGYLLDQFMQTAVNKRTDQYGGTVENRTRLLFEIFDAVATVFPANNIGVRLSPNGVYNDVGSPDFRETFLFAATELGKRNAAYLHVMDGLGFGFHKLGDPISIAEAKAAFKGPVIANIGYTGESANDAIQRGDTDLVSIGQPFISNPDLPERLQNGWPLNPPAPMTAWYGPAETGYVDFPTYTPQ